MTKSKWYNLFIYYLVKIHGVSLTDAEEAFKNNQNSYFIDPQLSARNYIHKNMETSKWEW